MLEIVIFFPTGFLPTQGFPISETARLIRMDTDQVLTLSVPVSKTFLTMSQLRYFRIVDTMVLYKINSLLDIYLSSITTQDVSRRRSSSVLDPN
jgi:hypothetical protein